MANPQKENGLTPIANEIVDALARVNLSAYESRVLWCIFRKTYGWNKKIDRISYSQFEGATGMKRWHIGRTLKLLVKRNIITCQGEGQYLEYGIQKDYEQWQKGSNAHQKPLPKGVTPPLPKGVTPDLGSTVTERGNSEDDDNRYLKGMQPLPKGVAPLPKGVTKPLPKGVNTKERKKLTKDNIQKKRGKPLKQKFGEFLNVFLTAEEYKKLVERLGEARVQDLTEALSLHKKSTGKRYEDDYATILNWARREDKNKNNGMKGGQGERPRIASRKKPIKVIKG